MSTEFPKCERATLGGGPAVPGEHDDMNASSASSRSASGVDALIGSATPSSPAGRPPAARYISVCPSRRRLSAFSEARIAEQLADLERRRGLPQTLRHHFVLDPRMNYAVHSHELRLPPDDKPMTETHNGEFRQLAKRKVWLPQTSRTTYRTWPTAGGVVTHAPLIELEIRQARRPGRPTPGDVRAQLHVAGHGDLRRRSGEGRQRSEIPASPKDLDDACDRRVHVLDPDHLLVSA